MNPVPTSSLADGLVSAPSRPVSHCPVIGYSNIYKCDTSGDQFIDWLLSKVRSQPVTMTSPAVIDRVSIEL